MKIEVHVLQNFPPSCLNRDDTNTPKDCEFGGVRRARVSSQCLKRAMRDYFRANNTVEVGERTKRLHQEMLNQLGDLQGVSEHEIGDAVDAFISTYYSAMDSKNLQHTAVLLFLSQAEIAEAAQCVRELWNADDGELRRVAAERRAAIEKMTKKGKGKKGEEGAADGDESSGETETKAKNLPEPKSDKAIRQRLEIAALSPDIALFGRMLAEHPTMRVDAAAQVAHAISTHGVSPAMDFYSAVDDLNKDDSGAGMLGVIGYNSACFYRYALLDREQLAQNLGSDNSPDYEAADLAIEGFLHAMINAIPSGKQNSMAAHSPASLAFFVVRESGAPASLVNAFAAPIRVEEASSPDLVADSVRRLCEYSRKVAKVYGTDGIRERALFSLHDDALGELAAHDKGSMQGAIDATMQAVRGEDEGGDK